MESRHRYDKFSVLLHWTMALLLLGQIGLGLWMLELPKDSSGQRTYWFNIHKSVGMLLGVLVLLRLIWAALRQAVPSWPASVFSQALARCNHRLLYALMVLLPVTGFLGSVFSGYPIRFFGQKLPKIGERWEQGKELMSLLHEWSAYGLMLLIAMHLLGVIYHQLIIKDALIRRMS